jgi:glycosyltransferase involved in cell wall biosynthesis
MREPPVSVLLTAFNREQYVGDAIESVLAQRFGDFELIVVDDKSTDSTLEIAHDYASRDKRIRVFSNESNLGQFPNRNHAATLARGTFIKYHDSDDVMYPHCLGTMVEPMLAEPSAAIGISLSRAFAGGPSPMLLTPRMAYQREFLGEGMFAGGPGCGIFRRDAFCELGGFPDRGVPSDFVFWLHACARVNVLTLPGDLFWYRIHPGQEAQSPAAAAEYVLSTRDEWEALASEACPLDPDERERARRTVVANFAKGLARDLRAGHVRLAMLRYRKSGLSRLRMAKYLRRPRRTLFSGTPTAANGEFLIPAWLKLQPGEQDETQSRQDPAK